MEFPEGEYRQRVDRARALMAEANLDAVLVTGDYTTAPNYRYFSGHVPRDYQSNSARPHLCLLNRQGDAAICVHFFSEAPARECWVKTIHVYTQPFRHADALALFRASQALAGIDGRDYVKPDEVKRLAVPVLAHRIMITAQSRLRGQDAEQIVRAVLDQTPVPVERVGADGR